jgi:hypothetical protein
MRSAHRVKPHAMTAKAKGELRSPDKLKACPTKKGKFLMLPTCLELKLSEYQIIVSEMPTLAPSTSR